ncbi:hypothetical protein HB4184_23265 [Pseudomonas putida]|nr:hypothetical protein HB4184_23265 [Pseudomonas putida]
MWVMSRLSQSHCTCWQGDNCLHMGEVGRKFSWPLTEDFIVTSRWKQSDCFTTHLPASRVIIDHAAKRVCN